MNLLPPHPPPPPHRKNFSKPRIESFDFSAPPPPPTPITYNPLPVSTLPSPNPSKFTLQDLRRARFGGPPVPILTCYDYTTATLMRSAGVHTLLVGDSASNVILGHSTTLPISLPFLIELSAAVRRGHPEAYLIADMPFGSYQASPAQGVKNICRMLKHSGVDAVKLELAPSHLPLLRRATDAGVATIAHLGLRPQAVSVLGGYRTQGRTPSDAKQITDLALACEQAGAVAILLEAVPSQTAAQVAAATTIPIIGCGAGPACHAHVVVTHDLLGLTPPPAKRPKFVPTPPPLPEHTDLPTATRHLLAHWVQAVESRTYPAPEHEYSMASLPSSAQTATT